MNEKKKSGNDVRTIVLPEDVAVYTEGIQQRVGASSGSEVIVRAGALYRKLIGGEENVAK